MRYSLLPVGLVIVSTVVWYNKSAGGVKIIALKLIMAVIITLGACFAISSDAIVERSKADIAARLSFLLYAFLI